MPIIGILDLLGLYGSLNPRTTKLVRHLDTRFDLRDVQRQGWIETYQSFQNKTVFDRCEHIVSFMGLSGARAEFIGVFNVTGRRAGRRTILPPGCLRAPWQNGRYFYELHRVPGYEALENRVVIDWGRGTLAWHQRARNKPVLEVRPPGFLTAPFEDYLDFTLTYRELRHLFAHAPANREWRARLAAIAAVYLILDSRTGHQYVGSAYGAKGVWGRWAAYAANGHGGNARLKALVRRKGYPDALTFSILQVLPRTTARSEILALESRFKAKLGTLATGLNEN